MFRKTLNYIKKNPASALFIFTGIFMCLVFSLLLSFRIMQADDYYYATFFKKGLGEFFRLTKDHFQNFNGRVLVHIFAQINLSLGHFAGSLLNSAIVFFIGFFAFKISGSKKGLAQLGVFISLFYALLCFSGFGVIKEAIMWTSAFYNYVFPFLILLLGLYFSEKNKLISFVFCFLSGATTEQWGVVAIVMLIVFHVGKHYKTFRHRFKDFLPSVLALLGYFTIFLSPATQGRINTTGHTTLAKSLFDIPRLSKVFFAEGSPIVLIVIFIVVMLLAAFLFKKRFMLLYSGFLPLSLILTLSMHKAYMATFIIFMCYLPVCFGVFFFEKHYTTAAFIVGALSSVLIMLPTNTFEPRIAFPLVILLGVAIMNTCLSMEVFSLKKVNILVLVGVIMFALITLYPSFMGFKYNSTIEKENLNAVKASRETGELYYNIDYDKNFAAKQMFNDGWFYTKFLELYSIEDCTVYIDSKNSIPIENYKSKALIYQGDVYIPMRTFLSEAGGTITLDTATTMTLNGKTLTLLDGVLTYHSPDGSIKYLIADDNRILNFYTLYIRSSVVNDALGTNLPTM